MRHTHRHTQAHTHTRTHTRWTLYILADTAGCNTAVKLTFVIGNTYIFSVTRDPTLCKKLAQAMSHVCKHGMGDVLQGEGRFTADKYITLLEEDYLLSLRNKDYPFPHGPIVFIQNKCPIHTDRAVQQWFQRQDNIELLDWPSKGADMNIIEHV